MSCRHGVPSRAQARYRPGTSLAARDGNASSMAWPTNCWLSSPRMRSAAALAPSNTRRPSSSSRYMWMPMGEARVTLRHRSSLCCSSASEVRSDEMSVAAPLRTAVPSSSRERWTVRMT